MSCDLITCHSLSFFSPSMDLFSPYPQSLECLVFTALLVALQLQIRMASKANPSSCTPSRVSVGLFIFSRKSTQFCTAPRCLAACPSQFSRRGSKFQIRGVTDRQAKPPLTGKDSTFLFRAEVAMSGGPEQMGLAVRVTWSTNTKLLKASAFNDAHNSGNNTEL